MRKLGFTMLAVGLWLAAALPAQAEPYLAVRSGQSCAACHVNPTGGGKRTEFGTVYGNTTLPAQTLDRVLDREVAAWDGRITDYFAIGADLRTSLQATDVPNNEEQRAFDSDRTTVYLDLRVIPNRLSVYIDERVAPGNAFNRESYLLLRSERQTAYLKAGRFFLPYGLRLEDDSAFIRQVSGINFNSSDDGVEGGVTFGPWALHLAVTNGAAGGAETNTGKQLSLLTELVYPAWRVGASLNSNNNDDTDRDMGNLFAGLRTGIIGWLGEIDYFVDDDPVSGRRKSYAGLFEANTDVARGHNLKLTYEYYDPNREVDEDERTRYSLVWEYTPFQALQLRAGYRHNEGIPQNDLQNAKELFLQLHGYL